MTERALLHEGPVKADSGVFIERDASFDGSTGVVMNGFEEILHAFTEASVARVGDLEILRRHFEHHLQLRRGLHGHAVHRRAERTLGNELGELVEQLRRQVKLLAPRDFVQALAEHSQQK